MGFKLKRLVKSAKKTVKKVGGVAIKAVKYAAPVVGTLVGGPVGGAAGTALAGVAATHRAKNKGAAFMRTVKYGGSVALAGGLGNVAGGGNFFSSNVLGNIGNIFSGGSAPKTSLLDEAKFGGEKEQKTTTGTLESLLAAFHDGGAGDKTIDPNSVDHPSGMTSGGKSSPEPDAVSGGLDGIFGAGSAGGGEGLAGGDGRTSPILWIGLGLATLWLLS